MKNKTIKIIVTVILANIFLGIVFNKIFNKITPDILNESIGDIKEDPLIINKIGKIDDFKYTFDDSNYYKNLPTKFELILFGEKRKMILNGILRKTNEKWIFMKTDTVFTNYRE